ncbi:MAG TPA: glycoside hydrolase family 38 C-terminal domain-containing protein [Bacteroidota bacterium]|nr:glycoside hydrolase family 38 C-terminal domain-containing protein [Bacteroidota bacterium]
MHTDLLAQTLPFVKSHTHQAALPLSEWKLKEGDIPNGGAPSLNDNAWWKYTIPAPWGGYDKTVWFRSRVTIPEEFAGKRVGLLIDLADALLYVNGKPYQGIDKNHQEVLLTEKARTNQTFLIAIEAYSGRKKELSTFNSAHLVVINPIARALHNGLTALHDLEKLLGPSSPETKEIKELIRQTLIFLKYFKPDGEEYPNAIGRAYNFLTRTLDTDYKTSIPGLVHLVSQSHIDVVWLWRLRETRKKCARTFSTALRLMEEYPEFNYSQSQAFLYQMTQDKYPEIFKEIKQRVAEGRWLAIGSTWVEPDCNIPNGEALVRQVLYGKRYFKNTFGVESDILWLPDTFGYSWALPQIMKKSGIKFFFTTKLTWNDTNQFPHNTFWWRGIDGSKILAHIPPVGLEGTVAPKDLKKSWDVYREKELVPHTIQTFGFGDGGGGPTSEQLDTARIVKSITGLPGSSISSVGDFFKAIEEQSKELETWGDELYLEKHRGTFTTHGWVKRENRRSEALLYTTELLGVLGMLVGNKPPSRKYQQRIIEEAWKKLLVNQFHDIVPGTSITEVYDDVRTDFEELQLSCHQVQEQSLTGLVAREDKKKAGKEFHFSIFNQLSWERSEYVVLGVESQEKTFTVTDSSGRAIEHQILGRRKGVLEILCHIEHIPPLSFSTILVTPSGSKPAVAEPWKMTNRLVETPRYRVRFDSRGGISSLHDKVLRRELVAKGARLNQFQAYRDVAKQWEAWDIEADYTNRPLDLFKFDKMKITEQGPLRATVRVEHKSDSGSRLAQEIHFYHKTPRIDFETFVIWKERQTLLKTAFPLNVKTHDATYEIQFGALQRTTRAVDSVQKAKFEIPAQQWADLSEQKFGVSLLNDCKYGYDASESTLRLTLLRSPHYPHALEPWRLNDDRVTDQGEHEFTYSLYPHQKDWREGGTMHRARELNQPVLIRPGDASSIPPLFTVSGNNILIDSIKKAEDSDDVIIRLHEAFGQSVKTTMSFGVRAEAISECDLMEQEIAPLKLAKMKLALKFSPFEIKTLKVKFRAKR